MKLSLSILGTEVWSLHFCLNGCAADEAESTPGIGGGEGGHFERDVTPLDPTDHYGEWEDRAPRRFGFGGMA
jgi:hypothetical protein